MVPSIRRWAVFPLMESLRSSSKPRATKPGPKARANKVLKELGDHSLTLSHARHIDYPKAEEIGLRVTPLEKTTTFRTRY